LDRPILIRLDHPAANRPDIVGNKFAGLARLKAAGFRVPAACAIPMDAARHLLAGSPESIRAMDAIVEDARRILDLCRGIAVRSSGLMEDNWRESGAGRFRTVLDVCDEAGLRKAIAHVLEGFIGEEDPSTIPGTVILQEMVRPDAAGVAFSRHPIRPSEDLVVIEAVSGLADRLVSGEIPGYRAILGSDGPPLPIRDKNGNVIVSSSDLVRLRIAVRSIEVSMGGSTDIEWAISDKDLFLLQARPALAIPGRRPGGTWTRAVAEDLWGDELCPLDASILLTLAPRFDLRTHARRIGIRIDENVQSVAAIEGYLYVNGDLLSEVLSRLPEAFGKAIAMKLLPPGKIPRRYAGSWKVLARMVAHGILDPGMNPLSSPWVTRRKIRSILDRLTARIRVLAVDFQGARNDFQFLLELHAELLEANQIPYLFAFLFTSMAGEGFAGKGSGNNPTSKLYRRMEELAAELKRHGDPVSPVAALSKEVSVWFDEFIAEYGSRSDIRSLKSPRWREEPGKILSLLFSMGEVRQAIPDAGGPSFRGKHRWMVSGFAARYLDLREEMRDALDRILDAERMVLLRIDTLMGWEGTVFDRDIDEIIGAGGKFHRRNVREGREKAEFPPRYFIDGKAVYTDSRRDDLQGIPASPGRAKGKCRKVKSLEEAMRSPGGEILIAWTMGPSWVPVLSKAKGVILAEGGMLSHFSIIAREQCVPCVVGAGKGILEIPDGTVVAIDGYEGGIRIDS